MAGYNNCEPGHGLNRVNSSTKKKGENKGIAQAKRARKRAEAEARNALTPPERRRAARRAS